jgi:hypothetical protein
MVNGYWIPTVLAATQSLKNPRKAVELLDAVMPYELGLPQTPTNAMPYPIYVRGLALLVAGQGRKAAEEFQKILDHPGIVGNYPLGALAHLGLGRAYALQSGNLASGNCPLDPGKCSEGGRQSEILDNASKAYEDFFALWKDADSDIPVLIQARTEYQSLIKAGRLGSLASLRQQ